MIQSRYQGQPAEGSPPLSQADEAAVRATTLQWIDRASYASLNAAIAAVPVNSQAVVYVPAGSWSEGVRAVVPANKTVSIVGDGIGRSVLTWTTTNGGIQFNGPSGVVQNLATAVVSDLSLVTSVANGGTALEVNAGHDLNGYYCNATIQNLEVRSSSVLSEGAPFWNQGLVLRDCWYPSVFNFTFTGSLNTRRSTSGLRLDGRCVNAHVGNLNILFAQTGIMITDSGDSTEGLTLNQSKMIYVGVGVDAQSPSGTVAGLNISQLHVDSFDAGIKLHKRNQVTISDCHLLKRDSPMSYLGVQAVECDDLHVQGCTMNVNQGNTSDNGLVLAGCNRATAVSNSFTGFDTSIWIKDSCGRCVAVGNSSQGGGLGTSAWLNQSPTSNMDTGPVGLNPWNP